MSNFCGARPHKMLTLINQNSMFFSLLSPELLWKTGWSEKEINFKVLSTTVVPEGHCLIKIKCTKWIKTLKMGINWAESARFRANSCLWPRLPPRWPCSFTLTVFQPGEGAPASLSTYTIGKKWKKCRDLRTGPIEISEFWHADSFARIMKKSFSQDLDWITP